MQTLDSSVTAVTVYRWGALVSREAELALSAVSGLPEHVQLTGLPLLLDDASLRVELSAIESEAGPLPSATDVRVTLAVPASDPALPPPRDEELAQARLDHARATRHREELRRLRAAVDGLQIRGRGAPEEGKPPAASPTGARRELARLRDERSERLDAALVAADARVHDTRERLATLKERARVASDAKNVRMHEVRKAAIVRLHAPGRDPWAPLRARLRLTYFVPGARWAPAYTVHLPADDAAGTIALRALVAQITGEDWRGVALTLSTAHPQAWTELPELSALRIGRMQPEPRKTGWRPPPQGAEELYRDYDRELRRAPPPSAAPKAAPTAAELDASSTLSGLLDEHAAADAPPPVPRRAKPAAPPAAFGPPPAPSAAPMASGGAPPAPQGAATPPTHMMPVSAPMSRSAGIGGLIGGVFGGAVESARAAFGPGGGDGGGTDMDDLPQVAPELVAGRELLEYGRLKVPGADAPGRGRLQRTSLRDLYGTTSTPEIELDTAFARLGAATRAADELERRAPPARHVWPDPEPGFDYAYVADAPIDLPSDASPTALPILSRPIDPRARYISVPRESQDVFRVVALRNPLEAPLLPGPADVYVGGTFALTSDLPTTPPDGHIELGLGVEQAIKIARNVDFAEDTTGLIKRHQELSHTIRIDVTNHLPQIAKVEIRERLPVVAGEHEDDVEVEVGKVDPPWDEYEQKDEPLEGGRRWTIEVPAASERRLTATWVAKIPGQHELVGGNRRET